MSMITIKSNADDIHRELKQLRKNFKFVPKLASTAIAEEAADRYRRALQRQGSVATRTGLNSIKVLPDRNTNTARLSMADYLQDVDEGTSAHEVGVAGNPRLDIWAKQRGMDPFALADHISKQGTRAHPFIDENVRITAKNADRHIKNYVEKAMRGSLG